MVYKRTQVKPKTKITTSASAYTVLKDLFPRETIEHHEQFIILLLDRANQVLGWSKISEGGINGTVVDVRIIFQIALAAHASSIILAHNHPSGNCKPSEQDKAITRKINKAGELLEIAVLDHLILVSESEYYSFSDATVNSVV